MNSTWKPARVVFYDKIREEGLLEDVHGNYYEFNSGSFDDTVKPSNLTKGAIVEFIPLVYLSFYLVSHLRNMKETKPRNLHPNVT